MIYGNKFLNIKNDSVATAFESTSVAYTEYTNRLSLLESCTNEEERSILEAQVQVLCEVSIKDIFSKIKEAWEGFKRFLRGIFEKLFGKKKEVEVKVTAAEKVAEKAIQKLEQEEKQQATTTSSSSSSSSSSTSSTPSYTSPTSVVSEPAKEEPKEEPKAAEEYHAPKNRGKGYSTVTKPAKEVITDEIWNNIKLIYVSASVDGNSTSEEHLLDSKDTADFGELIGICEAAKKYATNTLKSYVSGSMAVAQKGMAEALKNYNIDSNARDSETRSSGILSNANKTSSYNVNAELEKYNDTFNEGITKFKEDIDKFATFEIVYKLKTYKGKLAEMDRLSGVLRAYRVLLKKQEEVVGKMIEGMKKCKEVSDATVKEVDDCIKEIDKYVNGIRNTPNMKGEGDNIAAQKSLNSALVRCSNAIHATRTSLHKLAQKFGTEFTKAENAALSIAGCYIKIQSMAGRTLQGKID